MFHLYQTNLVMQQHGEMITATSRKSATLWYAV